MSKDALSIACDLIAIDSTNPGAYEYEVASYIEDYFENLPSYASFVKDEISDGRPIVKLEVEGVNPQQELVFICHMDTVPIGQGWTYNAFEPTIKDGLLYGRGACDMKSGLACAIWAIKDLLKTNIQPLHTIKFIGSCDEEADMYGIQRIIDLGWVQQDSLVLDTEPTDSQIQTAHKARYWFKYNIEGIAAHASKPHEGADANIASAYAISYINENIKNLKEDEFLGSTTLAIGQIKGGIHPYQVPGNCSFYIDTRVVPQYSYDDIYQILLDAASYAEAKIPNIKVTIENTGMKDAVSHNKDSALLELLGKSIEDEGYIKDIAAFPGYTDTAVISCALCNKECMSYGPGSLDMAHKPNEYVAIEDIQRACKVYRRLIDNFISK